MRYRDSYIEDALSLNNSGNKIIDIKVNDPISTLWLRFKATNHSTGPNADSPITRCISSIEIVDGSDVLYSLNGHQANANAAFDLGKMPNNTYQEEGTLTQTAQIPILFGRYIGDPEYYLHPGKFSNPQLKIAWDLETVNSIGANGFEDGSAELTLIAKIMEDAPDPKGFLMTKEQYSWETDASGDERIDLPTDYPYRRLMLRSYEAGTSLTSAITDVKLSVDNDKYVPFDLHAKDLARQMPDWFGYFTQYMKGYGDDSDVRQLWLDRDLRIQLTPQYDDWNLGVLTAYAGQYTIYMRNEDGTNTTGKPWKCECKGACPESTLAYPFGDQMKPEDWFQAQTFGGIRLFVTQGNAGGDASVFIQQLRAYE
ncbi:MAG: hypothetical protein DRJ03_19720 [Chloroflexi bacterium]|nr:MAG: hypothetical protein DRJ03_19720 [Chloroflexota bacterium]